MGLAPQHLVFLLVAAIAVALVARRVRLPYTVGLVVAGIGLAIAKLPIGAALTHDFIFEIILPPLLFEASIAIHWNDFRRDAVPILALAILGTLAAAAFVALGMGALLGWAAGPALIFGILTAATDPVAVIALFKDTGMSGRLRLIVEAESLLNDGVAAVLFTAALVWAQHPGAPLAPAAIAGDLLLASAGGLLVGAAVGGAAILAIGRTSDHLVETAVTTAAAYGAFQLADRLGVSGVLATVAAGILIGNAGRLIENENTLSPFSGGAFVQDVWEFAAFLANSLVFLLIGAKIGSMQFAGPTGNTVLVAIALVLAGRAATVYPICAAFHRSPWAMPLYDQHVLWWGGLRGALALALALALPASIAHHDDIIVATFGVVAFAVIGQGLTMPALLRVRASSEGKEV